jgi:hypothetical protein
VDGQASTVVELEDDDFERVARAVGAEQQRPARLVVSLLERVARERMLGRVNDVVVGDAMLARCAMNLRTVLV